MDTGSTYLYSCGGTARPRLHPKKRIAKLSRKQKLRKAAKKERGEATLDRTAYKQARDAHKIEQRLRAKDLW